MESRISLPVTSEEATKLLHNDGALLTPGWSPSIQGSSYTTMHKLPITIMSGLSAKSTITSNVGHMLRPCFNYRHTRKRVVLKNGECNVTHIKLSHRKFRYLQDIFTTCVDIQWRYTLLAFAGAFVGCWLLFGVIWYLICFVHGDLEPDNLPDKQAKNGWKPCVYNIDSFTSAFLFSIETQTTIGYGYRSTTDECPEAAVVVCLQSVSGLIMQAFMVGIVFAKMTRAKQRAQTLLFSKSAVICQRDGILCLMFRIGDMRKSHIIGANVRAQLIRPKQTNEGEHMNNYITELEIGTDNSGSDLFFIWPMIVVHKITPDSPFYKMSAADLIQDRFEIVVILEGVVESTGQTTQARSSYLNTEIMWGHRFDDIVSYNKDKQCYEINYSRFDSVADIETPLCSASNMEDFYKRQDEIKEKLKTFPQRLLERRKSRSMIDLKSHVERLRFSMQ